jgi:thiosulfate/3-mercaptopyruvate sulfurtransferase
MSYTTLIDSETLAGQLQDEDWVIFDCRFDLQKPDKGYQDYLAGHIPGARYAHLNNDLAATPGQGHGRHPLPDKHRFIDRLGEWGVNNHSQVVIYDDAGGALASRLWWLLRWVGHEAVTVLNGGLHKWQQENRPVTTDIPSIQAVDYAPKGTGAPFVTVETVMDNLERHDYLLLDARDEERFRGDKEPLDPVAGHIPGAVNAPFTQNLDANGCFKDTDALAQHFRALIGSMPPASIVHSCGSGVTACHNLLAMEHAGLKGSLLYPGSWSEWVADTSRPVATGQD